MIATLFQTNYLHLEDDITPISEWSRHLMVKMDQTNSINPQWFSIHFSRLGFIGPLINKSKLDNLITFILLFAKRSPIDWIFPAFIDSYYCGRDGKKNCDIQVKKHVIQYVPSIFQHDGYISSLAGKIQKLKDKNFMKTLPINTRSKKDIFQGLKICNISATFPTTIVEKFNKFFSKNEPFSFNNIDTKHHLKIKLCQQSYLSDVHIGFNTQPLTDKQFCMLEIKKNITSTGYKYSISL
ncbi:hypothetical protein SNEBB_002792 [Seison nebaliae]|nr:hypothetical protein SNEBB_002792 [Seison nebaliae]